MKKNLLISLFIAVFGLVSVSVVSADTFDVNVNIPAANGLSFTLWKLVDGQPFPTTPEVGTTLDWSNPTDLTLDTANGVFFGNHFYAIDVAPTGGVGSLNVLIQWNETADPDGALNDGTNGLDVHGIATVVKAFPDPDGTGPLLPPAEQVLNRETLANINNTTILASTLDGGTPGFMRMYVGLATGDPAASPPEPAEAVPFNLGNAAGTYSGVITLSIAP